MNKIKIFSVLIAISGVSQAATLTVGETFDVYVNADGISCFTFDNCVGNAASAFTDNNNDTQASNGSAIAGDGHAGVINITTASDGNGGVTFSVNTFNMDTYLDTAMGSFGTWADSTVAMSGSVDANGNISFDPAGRMAAGQFTHAAIGGQLWNTGSTFTSGNQFNAVANLTGNALAIDGTAVIVSASTIGADWGGFEGTAYTEVFSLDFSNATIIPSAVPVPAAAWLFASGLIGLAGLVKRKK